MRYYWLAKEFIKAFAASFGISKTSSRAGVMQFGIVPKYEIKLNDYFDLVKFTNAVDKLDSIGGETRLDLAIGESKKSFFLRQNGGRNGIKKLLVILTGGNQTKEATIDSVMYGGQLRKLGVTMLAVGVGNWVHISKLANIVGGKKQVFLPYNLSSLISDEYVKEVAMFACNRISKYLLTLSFAVFFMYVRLRGRGGGKSK